MSKGPIGDWDVERAFAQEYGWTPDQVDALPPEFVDEQLAIWQAQAEHRRKQPQPRSRGHK